MYQELSSSSLLYSDFGNNEMEPFWSKFAEINNFTLETYSGNFSEILDFYLNVGYHFKG